MARQTRLVLWTAALGIFLFILLRLFGQQPHQATLSSSLVFQNKEDVSSTDEKTQEIHIAAIVCGNRTTLGLTMMKSALIMCSDFIRFTLFVDNETSGVLNETIQLWPDNILKRMSLDMRPVSYPEDNTDEWNTLFKPCASVKLFLPSLLKEVDSVLYVDVDTVFLSPPLHIWQHLGKMNHTQLVALGPEMQDHTKGWYNKYASHPYYGKFAINSGVILMNLTKMRKFGWEKYVVRVNEQYKNRIVWRDQDIINIIFHFHPEKLYVYPCNYNYIPVHCSITSLCQEAEQQGIYILHGYYNAFINDHLPALKAIYTSMQQHSFGDNLQMLFVNMKENLMKTPTSSCRKVMSSILKLLMVT
ncbi:glucoside xylosyltransferase 2 isoform X1 [Daphnia magna]|uniref:glucoside xylosyltransferase 2 isoform X1 n=1 Tax=Daphnia magna TaxID=35525 RepID=UPI001E1BACBE|nr:glucoside xylosyltransferase 2 isoform X1 [Daphnia magna]